MILFICREFSVQSLHKLPFLSQKQNSYVVLSLITLIKLLFLLFCLLIILHVSMPLGMLCQIEK